MNTTKSFIENYNERIDHILTLPSGTHSVNAEKLEQWINAQASDRRRAAAGALAKNIKYITHKDVIASCATLITKMYNDVEKPILESKPFAWYVGGKDKSSYFIALLCYKYVKDQGLRLPDIVLTTNFTYDSYKEYTIFYFDDMSYSGSQLYGLLNKIHTETMKQQAKNPSIIPIDIRVGLCYISEKASILLKQLTVSVPRRKIENPFKIYYTEKIPSLESVLGKQLYTDCIIYFNPYSDSDCICYFDHKIADQLSTFLNVLRFGPVPPNTIDYSFIFEHEQRKPKTSFYTQENEQIDKDIQQTIYIPFINNCAPIPEDKYLELQSIPYHIFMLTASGMVENDGRNLEYSFYDIHELPIYKYKNSVEERCPQSWYKKMFKGGRSLRKTRKRRIYRK